ncbi:hypothetical protein CHCC20372_1058 [Bacillus paralicheniformis]|nr:hypothetical protein CHCC20372_1058 [Bacillus paralicheniformis]
MPIGHNLKRFICHLIVLLINLNDLAFNKNKKIIGYYETKLKKLPS